MLTREQLEKFLSYQIEMNEYLRRRVVVLEGMVADTERCRLTRNERARILKRDRNRCVECGEVDRLQVHHIVAFAKGGSNDDDNLITLCVDCHIKKHEGENAESYLKSHL